MWEERERYVFEEEVRRKDRLRKIREQVQLGPWHGMTRDEKRRGKNKAKRARQRERERAKREARRAADMAGEGEGGRGEERGKESGKGDNGKKVEGNGDEEVEGEGKENEVKLKKEEEEEEKVKQEEAKEDANQDKEGEQGRAASDQQGDNPTQEPLHPNPPPSPPPAPWPPHYCTCFSHLQCAAHSDIPDSCHLCASFYFAGYWCGMEKGWCNFVRFVEESAVKGWGLKVIGPGEGEREWAVVGWDEEAVGGRCGWV
jgi:hypothetical protein